MLMLHQKNVSSHKIARHSFGQAFLITLLLLVSKDFKMKMGFGSHEGSFFLKEYFDINKRVALMEHFSMKEHFVLKDH